MTDAPDIFLSYSRRDQARAKLFMEAFEREGFSVWWDMGLRAGEAYDEVTEAALRRAKAVVVLWSKASVASRWVRAEATLADRNGTLLPCMIEPCDRPIMFELTQTADLEHWRGEADDARWRAFVSDVSGLVARHGADPTGAAPRASATAGPSVMAGRAHQGPPTSAFAGRLGAWFAWPKGGRPGETAVRVAAIAALIGIASAGGLALKGCLSGQGAAEASDPLGEMIELTEDASQNVGEISAAIGRRDAERMGAGGPPTPSVADHEVSIKPDLRVDPPDGPIALSTAFANERFVPASAGTISRIVGRWCSSGGRNPYTVRIRRIPGGVGVINGSGEEEGRRVYQSAFADRTVVYLDGELMFFSFGPAEDYMGSSVRTASSGEVIEDLTLGWTKC